MSCCAIGTIRPPEGFCSTLRPKSYCHVCTSPSGDNTHGLVSGCPHVMFDPTPKSKKSKVSLFKLCHFKKPRGQESKASRNDATHQTKPLSSYSSVPARLRRRRLRRRGLPERRVERGLGGVARLGEEGCEGGGAPRVPGCAVARCSAPPPPRHAPRMPHCVVPHHFVDRMDR